MKSLPHTGTAAPLETLTPYLDDGFVSDLFPPRSTQGRHSLFSPAQLFRVLWLGLLTPAHSFNWLVELLAENRARRDFAFLPSKRSLPDAKRLHQFRDRLDLVKLRAINAHLLRPLLAGLDPKRNTVAIIDSTDLPAGTNPFKKSTGRYAAKRAEIGMRTRKSNHGKWLVGYKKHTFRLWLANIAEQVVLVPLMSWATPAHRQDVLFLEPSLRYCRQHLEFAPGLVVADMAYIHLEMQRRVREALGVGIVTRLRADFDLPKAIEPVLAFRCTEGQPLEWLGLHEREQLHWFAVRDPQPLCAWCPQQSRCPREFSFAPADHKIVFGTVPVHSSTAKRLLRRVRSWIEASQSFEKNQLGLVKMYLNSLRFLLDHGALGRHRLSAPSTCVAQKPGWQNHPHGFNP